MCKVHEIIIPEEGPQVYPNTEWPVCLKKDLTIRQKFRVLDKLYCSFVATNFIGIDSVSHILNFFFENATQLV